MFCYDIGKILVFTKNLIEYCAKLYLSYYSPCLDVAQYSLEISYTVGKSLHLAKSLVYLFKSLAHYIETGAETLIESFLKLFIYSLPHLIEFP